MSRNNQNYKTKNKNRKHKSSTKTFQIPLNLRSISIAFTIFGVVASLFVKGNDIELNLSVLNGWNISEKDFVKALQVTDQFNGIDNISTLEHSQLKQIKSYCISEKKNLIRSNSRIAEMIFMGNSLYEEPYNAKFLFSKGKIKTNEVPQTFSITTGSGRHKGKFTIVVKP